MTFPSSRGHLTRRGTGLLSPAASNAPARSKLHPAAWNVPGRTAQGSLTADAPLRRGRLVPETGLVGLCIGKRPRAVAETAPMAGLMSKSVTKGLDGMEQAKRNRMIPRFCHRHEEREGSFVTDLDTTRSPSRDLNSDSGSDSDTGDASRPSKRHNPAVSAQEAGTRGDGADRAAALGCPHAPPRCRPPPHRPQALRPA